MCNHHNNQSAHESQKVVSTDQNVIDAAEFYKHRKVLVTGGAGFIGSHLVEALVAAEADVTVLDNLSTGKKENLETVWQKICFIEGDIRSFKTCVAATAGQDLVFHQAAFVSAPESIEKPYECYEINVNGTLNLLNASHCTGTKKVVFASSAAVYGNTDAPCHEEQGCDPNSPYGVSKLAAEKYCQIYFQKYGLETICLRYFNVWGERQRADLKYPGALANFRDRIEKNLPITIYGDGSQTRDFINVAAIVQANLKLARLPSDQLNGQSINIASGTSKSLLEMIELLKASEPKYNLPISFEPARPGDIKSSAAINQKLQSLIDRFNLV